MVVAPFLCSWFSSNQKGYEKVLCICANLKTYSFDYSVKSFPSNGQLFQKLFFLQKVQLLDVGDLFEAMELIREEAK